MPAYRYRCNKSKQRFERFEPIVDLPVNHGPDCGGAIRRVMTGGARFMLNAGTKRDKGGHVECEWERTGWTRCGWQELGQEPRTQRWDGRNENPTGQRSARS